MFLYTNRNDETITEPAHRIEDIELPEEAFKADFELGKQYQDFTKELVRFSLFGIAGYGFLIKEILGEKNLGIITSGYKFGFMVCGLLCLASSVGFGVYCGELNKACLRMQITILRLLQRLGSDRWADPSFSCLEDVARWRSENEANLKCVRRCQKENLRRAYLALRVTVWSLISGIILTAVVFIMCLDSTTHMSIKKLMPTGQMSTMHPEIRPTSGRFTESLPPCLWA